MKVFLLSAILILALSFICLHIGSIVYGDTYAFENRSDSGKTLSPEETEKEETPFDPKGIVRGVGSRTGPLVATPV